MVFNSHLDTVPPYFGSGIIRDPKRGGGEEILVGRGANDVKSLI